MSKNTKSDTQLISLNLNENTISDKDEIVEIFNKQFWWHWLDILTDLPSLSKSDTGHIANVTSNFFHQTVTLDNVLRLLK